MKSAFVFPGKSGTKAPPIRSPRGRYGLSAPREVPREYPPGLKPRGGLVGLIRGSFLCALTTLQFLSFLSWNVCYFPRLYTANTAPGRIPAPFPAPRPALPRVREKKLEKLDSPPSPPIKSTETRQKKAAKKAY